MWSLHTTWPLLWITPPGWANKQCEAARAAFWGFSPAYIVVRHHVSQLTPLSYLSVRQLLWIKGCVLWVKWYTLCCTSPHQQSAWPWRWFNQLPTLLFCLNNPALFRNSRASAGCCALPVAMISPDAVRSASCRALLCSFFLVTHHVFSFRCCWSACIIHQCTLFFMRWPASRARNNLFFLLIWWCSISTIQSPS